jgi:uncharacterized protein (TIGR00297 family)
LLTPEGAVSTFVLAVIIFSLGQFKWTIPILTFFIFSSLISKVRKVVNPSADKFSLRKDKRDHIQVLANGGVPGMIILLNQLYSSEQIYFAYVSALAAVSSDTWSTEIGTMFKTKTFNIINFQKIEQGLSGGVSFNGFFGAMIGSALVVISAVPWIQNLSVGVLVIFISGLLGSLFDSFLGATVQAKYRCFICGDKTESTFHCNTQTTQTNGISWINNDTVNFSTSLFGAIVSVLLTLLIL